MGSAKENDAQRSRKGQILGNFVVLSGKRRRKCSLGDGASREKKKVETTGKGVTTPVL